MQGKEPWEGCCILCTWGLLSSSFKFLSIKILNWNIWTDVLPAVGNSCGRGSWNCEVWLFDDLGVNRVEVYIGAQSVYVFVGWVSLSSSWSVSHSLCASHRPCHEFSLTPWGHSHMRLWCVCPELDWQGSFSGNSRETKRKGQGFELKGFEFWVSVLTYLLQNVNYLPR